MNQKPPVIAGLGETAVGQVAGVSSAALHVQAITAAVADAGIGLADVDGLITCGSMVDKWPRHAMTLAENMGILHQLKFAHQISLGGASATSGVALAAQLVEAGRCRNVVVAGADPQLSGLTRDRAVEVMASFRHGEFEAPYGPLNPSCFGLLAQRHMYQYGTTSEQLAAVAVTQRKHAALTGKAHMMGLISVDDVLGSRMISSPLRMLDCSLISDGGGAVVVSTASAGRSEREAAVAGHGEGYARQDHISMIASLSPDDLGAGSSARLALEMAGCELPDIDVAMLYDCFTITPILLLESIGFCEVGGGGRYVTEEGIGLDSPVPVNTHGGLLSYAHAGYPSIIFGIIEAVRQLRGDCGKRQVEGASLALVHGLGGMFSVHSSLVLRRQG